MGVPNEKASLCATTRGSHGARNPPARSPRRRRANQPPAQGDTAFRDAAPTKLANRQFIIPSFLYGVQKARCMIDTGASISFTSQQVVDKLQENPLLQHTTIRTYDRKLIVSLGDGSTAKASEGVDIQMNFATDDLTAQCAILPSLPNGIDLILGNDFLSKFDILIRPARAECSWFSEKQNKHLCIHGCSTIMPVHTAPKRDKSYPDGRASQLRHHILTLGTTSDADSDIEIVDSVELGKRLRLMREKAQNKRMKNPALTHHDSLHDEVAYVLTTATLLKEVQAAVQADQNKRWQPSPSKRQKSSFRKCENSSCTAAAINLPCSRHPDRLMMACSTKCHKVAKQRRTRARGELASMQPRSDTDKADAEVEALTKSADYSLARSRHMHKQSMPDGSLAGNSTGQQANIISDTEVTAGAEDPPGIIAPIAKRKLDFDRASDSRITSENSAGNISSTQIDTKISSLRDSMLCTVTVSAEIPAKAENGKNENLERTEIIREPKPRAVSKAQKRHFKKPQTVTKENLCASSKRKLEAYRARDLEPQEGALANKNNEMFETILQSKLPESLIDETHASQVTWINNTLKKDFLCLTPMDGYRDMPIEEMVRIEDKGDLTNCPIPNRSYKIPRALLPSLEKFIVEMKNAGWIEESTSEFCSPVLIIPKGAPHENKGYRFVVDLRQLNARTKSLQYMVPELGEMWAKLRNAKFISKLDLRHGFWQMGLHPESRHKTSFSCEYGTFQYRVLPMGLLTASAAFQRWVEGRLKKHNLLWQRVNIGDTSEGTYLDQDNQRCKGWAACYMDDLIVFSNSAEDHQKHLNRLLEVLSEEKIHLSVEKCAWACQYVRFLGCIVGNNELAMDPKKVRAIITMPCPKAQEEIRVFLGLTGFYRKHIDGYARIVTPLTDLLKKGVNVIKEWTPSHTEAVETLKKAITQYPILRQFDPQRRIFLCTDASAFAIGGVLWQRYGEDPLPVAYVSRRLNKHELNYSVQELECLAIVYSVKKFRHYLLGSPFEIKVMSDHQSLQYLKKGREAGGRIARWAMALSEYNYQIEYLPGKSNLLGDALSRLVAIETEHIADGTRPRQTAELASLFPEVHSEIAWQASQGLLELESSTSENNANETNHFSDRDIDFTEFGYDRYEAQHESILYYQANVQQSFIDIKTDHYKLCPDFGSI